MKGLLIKDFMLMKQQKVSFMMIAFISIVLLFFVKTTTVVFSMLMYGGLAFSLNTIALDEMDNGNEFLFTLPFARKNYVKEKYTLCILIGGGLWLLGTAAALFSNALQPELERPGEYLGESFVYLIYLLLMPAVLLPLRLKYGCVNSAAAIMLAMAVIFTAMVLLSGGSGDFFGKKAYAVENIGYAWSFKLLFLFVFVACAGFIASYFVSKRIVEHKEF